MICKSLRIFPFKKGPYKKVCIVIGFSGHQKQRKNMCRGIKNNTEEVFDGIFNAFNSDKGHLLSENESEDDIWSQTGQLHVIMTIRRPSPRKELKSIRQQVVQQMRQRDQMSLTDPL